MLEFLDCGRRVAPARGDLDDPLNDDLKAPHEELKGACPMEASEWDGWTDLQLDAWRS